MAHGDVVEHQRGRPQPGVGRARRGEPLPALLAGVPGRRRLSVGYDGAATPISASTRRLSSLLVGSMIRASTSCRNTSSRPVAASNPSSVVGAAQPVPQMPHPRGHDRQRTRTTADRGSPRGRPGPDRAPPGRRPAAARAAALAPPAPARRAPTRRARSAAPRAAIGARSAPPSPRTRSSPCARTPRQPSLRARLSAPLPPISPRKPQVSEPHTARSHLQPSQVSRSTGLGRAQAEGACCYLARLPLPA